MHVLSSALRAPAKTCKRSQLNGYSKEMCERFWTLPEYSPYGERKVYKSIGSNDPSAMSPVLDSQEAISGASYGICEIGHQGLILDKEFGLYYNRARYLSPRLGRFVSRDPLEYVDGMSLYEYVGSGPADRLDPMGLERKPNNPRLPARPMWMDPTGESYKPYNEQLKQYPSKLVNNLASELEGSLQDLCTCKCFSKIKHNKDQIGIDKCRRDVSKFAKAITDQIRRRFDTSGLLSCGAWRGGGKCWNWTQYFMWASFEYEEKGGFDYKVDASSYWMEWDKGKKYPESHYWVVLRMSDKTPPPRDCHIIIDSGGYFNDNTWDWVHSPDDVKNFIDKKSKEHVVVKGVTPTDKSGMKEVWMEKRTKE